MHEIISLQLGQSSNYLATHFWNTQEAYFTYGDDATESAVDPDVHWRAGLGSDGSDTFLPRTVIYDLKGGFGSLRKINALYDPGDEPSASLTWEGKSVLHKLPQVSQSAYQQSLDTGEAAPELSSSSVRYWSDFSRVFYHPKSLNQLYDYELNSSIRPFDKWNLGQELFQTLDREQDMVDRDFRPFVEEADQMQGIQLFTSLDDAWGGFAADYLERMRDEYPKATIWTWGMQAPRLSRAQLPNAARSIVAMCEQASMLVPLTTPLAGLPPNVHLAQDSPWQTTALLSTALESAGFASRVKSGPHRTTLGNIVGRLNLGGKQTLGRLQMSVSEPQGASDDRDQSPSPQYGGDDSQLDIDFFHLSGRKPTTRQGRASSLKSFGQFWTYRAVAQKDAETEAAEDDLSGARHRRDQTVYRYREDTAFPLLDSYPKIYTNIKGEPMTQSAAVTTNLSTDTGVSGAIKELSSLVGNSIGIEDREDLCNSLAELADAYHDGWSSGSDDGEDD